VTKKNEENDLRHPDLPLIPWKISKISESVKVFRINYLTVTGSTDWQKLLRHGILKINQI
jgi:hypothetical protein